MKNVLCVIALMMFMLAACTPASSVLTAKPLVTIAPPPMPTITSTPTQTPTVTPTPLPFKGKIAFVSSRSGKYDVYVINTDGSDVKDLTGELSQGMYPAWSPDGNHIAFTSPVNGIDQVFTMKDDGSELKQLTFNKNSSFEPAWTPDGKYIIWISSKDDIVDDRSSPIQQGYIMKPDGSEQRRLTNSQEFVDDFS